MYAKNNRKKRASTQRLLRVSVSEGHLNEQFEIVALGKLFCQSLLLVVYRHYIQIRSTRNTRVSSACIPSVTLNFQFCFPFISPYRSRETEIVMVMARRDRQTDRQIDEALNRHCVSLVVFLNLKRQQQQQQKEQRNKNKKFQFFLNFSSTGLENFRTILFYRVMLIILLNDNEL